MAEVEGAAYRNTADVQVQGENETMTEFQPILPVAEGTGDATILKSQ